MPNPVHVIPAGVRVLSEPDTDRDTWLEARKAGIGGSDALAVAGLDRGRSPLAVWLEKTGQAIDTPDNPLFRFGRMMEPVLADWFAQHTGIGVFRCGMLGHPTNAWQLFTPDRLTDEGGIVEIKTAGFRAAKAWEDGKVADRAAVQLQHGMAVTGLGHGYAVVGVWGQDPQIRYVARNQNMIDDLTRIEAEFWERVTSNTPPPLGQHPQEQDVLRYLYPTAVPGTSTELSPEAYDALQEYVQVGAQIDTLTRQRAALQATVVGELGTAEEGTWHDAPVVTWRNTGRISRKAFLAQHPELVEQYTSRRGYTDWEALLADYPAEAGDAKPRRFTPRL